MAVCWYPEKKRSADESEDDLLTNLLLILINQILFFYNPTKYHLFCYPRQKSKDHTWPFLTFIPASKCDQALQVSLSLDPPFSSVSLAHHLARASILPNAHEFEPAPISDRSGQAEILQVSR